MTCHRLIHLKMHSIVKRANSHEKGKALRLPFLATKVRWLKGTIIERAAGATTSFHLSNSYSMYAANMRQSFRYSTLVSEIGSPVSTFSHSSSDEVSCFCS